MTKELKTAEELSDMIVSALGVNEVPIRVRKDHAYGWQPTVISSPGDSIGYQRRVEEIANRLRFSVRPAGITSRLRSDAKQKAARRRSLCSSDRG